MQSVGSEGPSPLQVLQAVLALYGTDRDQQAAANTFLNQLASSDAAWEPCLVILESAFNAEVQFFCVNMLLSKVRGEWSRLNPDLRSRVLNLSRDRILSMARGGPAASTIVCQRLCLLLASACALSGPDYIGELVAMALDLAQSVTGAATDGACQAACTLLLSLAEEMEGADRARRQALAPSLLPRVAPVLGLLEALLTSSLDSQSPTPPDASGAVTLPPAPSLDPQRQATHQLALRALAAWARIDFSSDGVPSQAPHLSPGALHRLARGLLMAVLQHLGAYKAAPQLFQLAVDALLDLYRPGADRGLQEGGEEHETAALALAYQALTALPGPQLTDAQGQANGGADPSWTSAASAGVCRVASALAELNPEAACGADIPEAPRLAELVLRCLSVEPPSPLTMEAAADYFLMVNLVSMEDRRAEFRAPLYAAVVPICLKMASYPPGFTTWDDAPADLDEEAFDRLREHTLAELVDASFGVLKSEFLGLVIQFVAGQPTWQSAEAACFALRAAGLGLRDLACSLHGLPASSRSSPGPTFQLSGGLVKTSTAGHSPAGVSVAQAPPGVAEEVADFLVSFFEEAVRGVAGANAFGAHAAVTASCCRMFASYAKWIQVETRAPLEGCIRYLLWAMTVEDHGANKHAASAFNSICSKCSHRLATPQVISSLIQAAAPALNPPLAAVQERWARRGNRGMLRRSRGSSTHIDEATADRGDLVTGLTRVAAQLGATAAVGPALCLAEPLIERCRQIMAAAAGAPPGPRPEPVLACMLACELHLISSTLRFLEFPTSVSREASNSGVSPNGAGIVGHGGSAASPTPSASGLAPQQHPVEAVIELAWPMIVSVLNDCWPESFEVAASLCELAKRAMQGSKGSPGGRQVATLLLQMAGSLFQDKGHAMGLVVVGLAAELYFKDLEAAGPSDPLYGPIEQAFSAAVEGSVKILMGLPPGDDRRLDVVRYLFDMSSKVLLFLPQLHLAPGLALGLAQLAVTALATMRERDPLVQVMAWLVAMLGPGDKVMGTRAWQAYGASAWASLLPIVPQLAEALMAAVADTAPRQLHRNMAVALMAFMNNPVLSAQARASIPAAAQAATAGLTQQGVLTETDVGRFVSCALRPNPLPKQRFEALVADFALLCRREASSDVLLGYEC